MSSREQEAKQIVKKNSSSGPWGAGDHSRPGGRPGRVDPRYRSTWSANCRGTTGYHFPTTPPAAILGGFSFPPGSPGAAPAAQGGAGGGAAVADDAELRRSVDRLVGTLIDFRRHPPRLRPQGLPRNARVERPGRTATLAVEALETSGSDDLKEDRRRRGGDREAAAPRTGSTPTNGWRPPAAKTSRPSSTGRASGSTCPAANWQRQAAWRRPASGDGARPSSRAAARAPDRGQATLSSGDRASGPVLVERQIGPEERLHDRRPAPRIADWGRAISHFVSKLATSSAPPSGADDGRAARREQPREPDRQAARLRLEHRAASSMRALLDEGWQGGRIELFPEDAAAELARWIEERFCVQLDGLPASVEIDRSSLEQILAALIDGRRRGRRRDRPHCRRTAASGGHPRSIAVTEHARIAIPEGRKRSS